MLKKITYLLLFLLCFSGAKAQSYFNNRYEIFGSWDVAHSIVDCDSVYFVSSVVTDSTNFYRVCIQKIDTSGVEIKKWTLGKNNWYYSDGYTNSMILTEDTNLIYAGGVYDAGTTYLASLVKFNLQGDTLWTKTFGDSINGYLGYQCKQTTDKGYILVGAMDDGSSTQALLIKTDSLGNKQWEQNYGGAGIEYGFSVCVMPDKGFLIAGQTTSYGNGSANVYLLKTDSLGNLQWYKYYGTVYDEYATNIIPTSDGKYVYSGFRGSSTQDYSWPTLTKIDSLGNQKWDKTYGPLKFGTALYGLQEIANGEIVAVGNVEYQGLRMDGLVVKADSSGNQIWYRHPSLLKGSTSINFLYGIDITNSGAILASGYVSPSSPDTGSQDIWVIKLDEWGCDTLNCQYAGVDEIDRHHSVKIYPNPNNGDFTLRVENFSLSNKAKLEVFDAYGRMVHSQMLSAEQTDVSLPNLCNGIYFVRLWIDYTTLVSEKLIIQN